MCTSHPLASVALLGLVLGSPVAAQNPNVGGSTSELFTPGRVVERMTALSDTTQTYALYVPLTYGAGRKWPVLFVMDPRGRALIPIARLEAVAERLGYIVMSSYSTLSDGPVDPNEKAVNAMLADAQQRFAVDDRRFYLVGMSGTARVGWRFGYALKGHAAGLIGFAAGLPTGTTLAELIQSEGKPFVFFGGAGTTDFNYEEVLVLDRDLDQLDFGHRIEFWDGPHGWPPEETFVRALTWMELQAMKWDLRSRDTEWIQALYSERLGGARSAESSQQLHRAFVLYRAIASDFADLLDVSHTQAKAAELQQSEVVQRTLRQMDDVVDAQLGYTTRFFSLLEIVRSSNRAMSLEKTLELLEIDELKNRAEQTSDPIDALAAQRLLETVFVYTSFYEPRTYLEEHNPSRALTVLQIARTIKPDHPRVCYNLARAYTQMEKSEEALEALACFAKAPFATADGIEDEEAFAPLRNEPEYRRLVEELKRR